MGILVLMAHYIAEWRLPGVGPRKSEEPLEVKSFSPAITEEEVRGTLVIVLKKALHKPRYAWEPFLGVTWPRRSMTVNSGI